MSKYQVNLVGHILREEKKKEKKNYQWGNQSTTIDFVTHFVAYLPIL